MNISRRRSRNGTASDGRYDESREDDGFFDEEIDDEDMLAAGKLNRRYKFFTDLKFSR